MLELPARWIDEITELRIGNPGKSHDLAQARRRRRTLTNRDGRLNIIAADHPARRVTQAGDDPFAMSNRQDYLFRIASILAADLADGVMATMDILEELLLLSHISAKHDGTAFLNEKVMIASLNRGGLSKTAWELDDPVTGIAACSCNDWNLDGGKMLLRIEDEDPDSLKTIVYCRDAVNELLEYDLPMFLEPLPVVRTEAGLRVKKDWQSLVGIVGVASAIGSSSSRMWLKLPYCENFGLVAASTTLPILVLGGESKNRKTFLGEISAAMDSAHNVRGVMVGRNVLYGDSSPLEIAAEVNQIVHKSAVPK